MPEPAIDLEEFKADYMNTQYRICTTLEEMQAAEAEFDRAIAKIKADAWRDGAQWAAVELGAIAREENQWVTDADNPYIAKP